MIYIIFFLGLSVGSFLNVLIDRLPKNESFWTGRSYCDHCRHKLSWKDLVPLLSFLFLKRKCRYCQGIISWQYPAVELTCGILFAAVYILTNNLSTIPENVFPLSYFLSVVSGLLVVFYTDLKYRIIPDEIIFGLIAVSSIYNIFFHRSDIIYYFASAIVLCLFFLFLFLITSGRGMGLGDVKLALAMGLILGFPQIVVAFYISFLTGAIFSAILIMGRKKTVKSTMPFGPFLSLGTVIALFYGNNLWELMKKIMGI